LIKITNKMYYVSSIFSEHDMDSCLININFMYISSTRGAN